MSRKNRKVQRYLQPRDAPKMDKLAEQFRLTWRGFKREEPQKTNDAETEGD